MNNRVIVPPGEWKEGVYGGDIPPEEEKGTEIAGVKVDDSLLADAPDQTLEARQSKDEKIAPEPSEMKDDPNHPLRKVKAKKHAAHAPRSH